MNIIVKALNELRYRIPQEILREAFKNDVNDWRQSITNLDEKIMNTVIRPRVLIDMDIVGGQTILVSLNTLTPRFIDIYSVVYEIPSELLMHRSLMSVLSVSYLPFNTTFNYGGNMATMNGIGTGNGNPSDVMGAAQRVGDAMSSIPNVSNASVDIVGYNTVLIRDQLRITSGYQLRCVVGNEENLNNINPRNGNVISKLVELAVKSYIYNNLTIKIDQAYLTGGQELGRFKEVVDSYSDSEQMYQDYLNEVLQATMFMQNTEDHARFIKLQISGGL